MPFCITKIGKKYYCGGRNITKAVKEILQENIKEIFDDIKFSKNNLICCSACKHNKEIKNKLLKTKM